MEATRNETTGRWTLTGVEPSEVTFERMCKMLREGENFKFARYGDGEFLCMSGKVGHNCDGHEYFPDLGTALNDAFYSNPEYMVGIQPLSVQGGLHQRATINDNGPKNIYDADVLHSASIDGKLPEFFDSLKGRDCTLIGPEHLGSFADKNGFGFLQIPSKNCWLNYKTTISEIDSMLIYEYDYEFVFLLCASMMSEAIIDTYKDSQHTFIDCGSVFDVYAGKPSRSYHHKLKHANL